MSRRSCAGMVKKCTKTPDTHAKLLFCLLNLLLFWRCRCRRRRRRSFVRSIVTLTKMALFRRRTWPEVWFRLWRRLDLQGEFLLWLILLRSGWTSLRLCQDWDWWRVKQASKVCSHNMGQWRSSSVKEGQSQYRQSFCQANYPGNELGFFGVLAFLGFHVLTFSLVKFSPVRFSFSTSRRLFIPLFWMCCLQQSCFGYLAAFLCISCPLTPTGYLK